jgi:hypothetical protein
MASIAPIFNFYRLLPRKSEFLDRRIGGIGEFFYDQDSQTLRLYDGRTPSGIPMVSQNNLLEQLVDNDTATVTYTVTVTGPTAPDVGNKYNFDGVYKPTLNLIVGYTYVFNQDDLTNVYFPNANGTTLNPHPLQFSEDDVNGQLADGTLYTSNVVYRLDDVAVTQETYTGVAFNNATKREVWLSVNSETPQTLYYYCAYHLNMGSTITTAAPGSGSVGGGNVTVSVSESLPSNPVNGNLWLNTNNGSLYVYVTDADGSQWIQPAVPYPIQPEETVAPPIEFPPPFTFSVAADDSTQRVISSGELLQFIGAGGITTASDTEGNITITGTPAPLGNIVFTLNNIDTADSSAITLVPATIFNSDVTIENELIVNRQIVGLPVLTFTATDAVRVSDVPFGVARLTTAQRNLFAPQNGEIIYNTTDNKFQGVENGVWVNLV